MTVVVYAFDANFVAPSSRQGNVGKSLDPGLQAKVEDTLAFAFRLLFFLKSHLFIATAFCFLGALPLFGFPAGVLLAH